MAVPFDPMSGAVFPFDPAMLPLGQGQAPPQLPGPGPIVDPNDPRLLEPTQFAPPEVPVPQPPPTPAPGTSFSTRAVDPNIAAGLTTDQSRTLLPGQQRVTDEANVMANQQRRRVSGAADDVEAATIEAADVQARALDAQTGALRSRLTMEQGLMAAEQAAHEISVGQVQAARGRFEQQLAANRAMTVDPTLNFTAGESLGNAASLFAQGFLQAGYGIKIDVAGTLDRWTDRYVSNQMEKIRRGERLAEQDRVVWEMIRTESADEQDARDRYRAFAMSQAATAMEIEASRWGSELARAKGAEQAAAARMAVANQLNTLQTGWYGRIRDGLDQEFQHWAKRWELSIAQQRADADELSRKAAAPADYLEDVTDSGGQRVKWQFKPGTNDTAKNETKNRVAGQAALAYQMVQGMKLAKESGPLATQVMGVRGLHPEVQRRYAAWVDGVVQARVLMLSGKAATDTERKYIQAQFPMETWLTNGDNSKMYADFLDKTIDENQRFIDVHTDPVAGSDGRFAPGEKALADMLRAESAVRSPEEQAFDRAARPGGHSDEAQPASDWDRKHGVPISNGKVPDWSLDMQALHLAAEEGHEDAIKRLEKMAGRAFADTDADGKELPALPERAAVASSILSELRAEKAKSSLTPIVFNQDGTVAAWEDASGNQYRPGPDGRPVLVQ